MYDTSKKFLEFVPDHFVEHVKKYSLKNTFEVLVYCMTVYGHVTPDMFELIKSLLDRGVIKV